MNIVPKVGMSDVPFGMPIDDLTDLLGQPSSEQFLCDTDGYPKSRRVLNYSDRAFLLTPSLGVVAIAIESQKSEIELWRIKINKMSPSEFANMLESHDGSATISEPDGWGDLEVESIKQGIVASFNENQLESIEVHDPSWRTDVTTTT